MKRGERYGSVGCLGINEHAPRFEKERGFAQLALLNRNIARL